MKQAYRGHRFTKAALLMIETVINPIIDEYHKQGYKLTIRQLYYQLVARDLIPNEQRAYKRLIQACTDGRMAGLIDWDMIVDRTREFDTRPRWTSGQDILSAIVPQFHMDMWENQENRVFIIVEKEALMSVFEPVAREFDVPLLAARGYPSASVMRDFAESEMKMRDQHMVVLHFGDHDPSGIDMTRDIEDRLTELGVNEYDWELDRLALNLDQVHSQKPPPNPAKTTDVRFRGYKKKFGTKSWELDALHPAFLTKLAEKSIRRYIDADAWQEREDEIEGIRERLDKTARNFNRRGKR
jgi:hypothetical protein